MEAANAEVARLSEAVKELAVKLTLLEEEGLRMAVTEPVPVRVDAVGKAGLLGLVDHAVGEGWSLQAVCGCSRSAGGGSNAGRPGARTWPTGSPAGSQSTVSRR